MTSKDNHKFDGDFMFGMDLSAIYIIASVTSCKSIHFFHEYCVQLFIYQSLTLSLLYLVYDTKPVLLMACEFKKSPGNTIKQVS